MTQTDFIYPQFNLWSTSYAAGFFTHHISKRFSLVMLKHIFLLLGTILFIRYLRSQYSVTFMRCCGSCGQIALRSVAPKTYLPYRSKAKQRTGKGLGICGNAILYKKGKKKKETFPAVKIFLRPPAQKCYYVVYTSFDVFAAI